MVFFKPRTSLHKKSKSSDGEMTPPQRPERPFPHHAKPTAASAAKIISRLVSGALDNKSPPRPNARPLSGSSVTSSFTTLNAQNVTLQNQVQALQGNNNRLVDQIDVLENRLFYASMEIQFFRTVNVRQAKELQDAKEQLQQIAMARVEALMRHHVEQRKYDSLVLDIRLAEIMEQTRYISVDDLYTLEGLEDSDSAPTTGPVTLEVTPEPSLSNASIHDLFTSVNNMVSGMISSNNDEYGSWKSKLNSLGLRSSRSFARESGVALADSMKDVKARHDQLSTVPLLPSTRLKEDIHLGSPVVSTDAKPAFDEKPASIVSLVSLSFSDAFFERSPTRDLDAEAVQPNYNTRYVDNAELLSEKFPALTTQKNSENDCPSVLCPTRSDSYIQDVHLGLPVSAEDIASAFDDKQANVVSLESPSFSDRFFERLFDEWRPEYDLESDFLHDTYLVDDREPFAVAIPVSLDPVTSPSPVHGSVVAAPKARHSYISVSGSISPEHLFDQRCPADDSDLITNAPVVDEDADRGAYSEGPDTCRSRDGLPVTSPKQVSSGCISLEYPSFSDDGFDDLVKKWLPRNDQHPTLCHPSSSAPSLHLDGCEATDAISPLQPNPKSADNIILCDHAVDHGPHDFDAYVVQLPTTLTKFSIKRHRRKVTCALSVTERSSFDDIANQITPYHQDSTLIPIIYSSLRMTSNDVTSVLGNTVKQGG